MKNEIRELYVNIVKNFNSCVEFLENNSENLLVTTNLKLHNAAYVCNDSEDIEQFNTFCEIEFDNFKYDLEEEGLKIHCGMNSNVLILPDDTRYENMVDKFYSNIQDIKVTEFINEYVSYDSFEYMDLCQYTNGYEIELSDIKDFINNELNDRSYYNNSNEYFEYIHETLYNINYSLIELLHNSDIHNTIKVRKSLELYKKFDSVEMFKDFLLEN